MRRKACIFLVFTIMLIAAQSVFAAPTRLGKIVLLTPKNKTVEMKRNGKWIKTFEGADLYKDDFLKPQSGATVKILCTTSLTNFFPKRVPEEIPSSVNNFCSPQKVTLVTQRVPSQTADQETIQNGAAVDGSSTVQTSRNNRFKIRRGNTMRNLDPTNKTSITRQAGRDIDPTAGSASPRTDIDSTSRSTLTQQEAISSLETLITEGSQVAFVYRQLGDLYQQTKQPDKAETRYLKAVELATTAKDVEEKAAAQVGLGELYAARGNVNQAVRYLKDAQTGYESLGNRQHANTIKQRIQQVTR
jgi:tetratricopeptide (TPR) repeat protein